jgi:hypothetical protein
MRQTLEDCTYRIAVNVIVSGYVLQGKRARVASGSSQKAEGSAAAATILVVLPWRMSFAARLRAWLKTESSDKQF